MPALRTWTIIKQTADVIDENAGLFAMLGAALVFLPQFASRLAIITIQSHNLELATKNVITVLCAAFNVVPITLASLSIAGISVNSYDKTSSLKQLIIGASRRVLPCFAAGALVLIVSSGSFAILAVGVVYFGKIRVPLQPISDAPLPAIEIAVPLLVWLAGQLWLFGKALPYHAVFASERVGVIGGVVRSWRLTNGNVASLAVFYLIILIGLLLASLIVSVILGAVFGILAALTHSGDLLRRAPGDFGTPLLLTLYEIVISAASGVVYRQLAGNERAPVTTRR